MKHEIVMPQMGESITNGTITTWHKKEGEEIKEDDILLEISTDKVESEIPSPYTGRVEKILFEEGETVDVGILIAVIEDDLSKPFSSSSETSSTSKIETKEERPSVEKVEMPTTSTATISSASSSLKRFYTPLVKAMAKEAGISLNELENLQGSGAGGRVNKADFENYLQNRSSQNNSTRIAAKTSNNIISPKQMSQTIMTSGSDQIIPMDNMRKAIAKNMVQSKLTAPHVNSIDEIDMTNIVNFRNSFKEEFKKAEGFSLTYTHFILYAIVQALKEFPLVNASLDGDNIIIKKDINLGCAVAVPGNGLVVPTIKSADSLNITGLARAVNSLAQKARSKKLTIDEMTGGTFTFSNVGSFGTLLATPIILQPQVGIMAAGVIKKRVMVLDNDQMAIRSMMYLTHTYDHRLVDGEQGGKFLETVKRNLEQLELDKLF